MNKGRRPIKMLMLLMILVVFAFAVQYAWVSFPIITGYSAKMACSCVYLSGRTIESVEKEELGKSPLNLASLQLNKSEHSVTASLLGLARQKAIYRPGMGCTLINERSEAELQQAMIRFTDTPAYNQDTLPWPQGDVLPDSFPRNVNRSKLEEAVQHAFTEENPEQPLRTRAVVVLYNGQLVAEKYAPGFDRHTRLLSWSMAKSLTSALIGILAGEGKLDIHAPAPVDAWSSVKDGRETITIENILQQSTGIAFEENYSKASNATNMLFRQADMGGYTASLPLKDKPGTTFYYSSGNSNILSGIIRKTTGQKEYYSFPSTALFNKIGMLSAVMETDAAGNYVSSSYAFANARDWARFGLLYANDGQWLGKQVLPAGWVRKSITPAPAAPQGKYGYQFWLNAGIPGKLRSGRFPELPADLYYADGYEGQYVFVIPSAKLVVVRLGQTAGEWFDLNSFLQSILSSISL
jgi:CubicO group peptidase (beta-lactamase class C family)